MKEIGFCEIAAQAGETKEYDDMLPWERVEFLQKIICSLGLSVSETIEKTKKGNAAK